MIVKYSGEYVKQKVRIGKKNKVIFVEEPIFQQIGRFSMSEFLFYDIFGAYDSNSGNVYINKLDDYILSNVEIPYQNVISFMDDVKRIGERLVNVHTINEFAKFILYLENGYQQIANSGANSEKIVLEFIGDS